MNQIGDNFQDLIMLHSNDSFLHNSDGPLSLGK